MISAKTLLVAIKSVLLSSGGLFVFIINSSETQFRYRYPFWRTRPKLFGHGVYIFRNLHRVRRSSLLFMIGSPFGDFIKVPVTQP